VTGWEQFWDGVSVLDVALAVIAFSLVIGFIVKGWAKLRAGIRLIDTLGTLPDRLDRIDSRLDDIHHETHKNDGSSIKDATIRTENAVDRIELGMRSVSDRLDELARTDDALSDRLDGYEDTLTKE